LWILLICCRFVFAQEIKVKRFQRTVSLLEVADLCAALLQGSVNGGGIVVGFEVADQKAAWKVVDSVELFSRTANLGDVRSTITHPWTTTHGRMQPEEKLAANIRPGLIRLSVGLEHIDDLIDDLQQALNK